jgi:hypothetical protein
MVRVTKIEVPCSGCSTDPCYHWPYCTELLSLRAEVERLRQEREMAQAELARLRLMLSRMTEDI